MMNYNIAMYIFHFCSVILSIQQFGITKYGNLLVTLIFTFHQLKKVNSLYLHL